MNIFELAQLQLIREAKPDFTDLELLNRAKRIRKWFDKHGANTARAIMQGAEIYNYNGKIKTYTRG